jgi:restriction system protein
MALWGVRAGGHGENEDYALSNNVAIIGYGDFGDASQFHSLDDLKIRLRSIYPELTPVKLGIWAGQIWSFAHNIKKGDLIALPRKGTGQIAFGEVIADYRFDGSNIEGRRHQRPIRWLDTTFARTRLDDDIINSLGSLLTVFRVKAKNAEERIRAAISGRNHAATIAFDPPSHDAAADLEASTIVDLERTARDRIIEYIGKRFLQHRLEELVEAVLIAQGFVTDRTPPGPDGGCDILASRGPLGLDGPKIAIQVKSSATPSDVAQVRALKGILDDFGADIGLFVAWSGFRGIAVRDSRRDFFQLRLWDAETLLDQILMHYDQLPRDIQAELPLKRVWTLVSEAEEAQSGL